MPRCIGDSNGMVVVEKRLRRRIVLGDAMLVREVALSRSAPDEVCGRRNDESATGSVGSGGGGCKS